MRAVSCVMLTILLQNPVIGQVRNLFGSVSKQSDSTRAKLASPFKSVNVFSRGLDLEAAKVYSSVFYNRGLFLSDLGASDHSIEQNIRAAAVISVYGFPVNIEGVYRNSSPEIFQSNRFWFKASFEVDAYQAKWKKAANALGPELLTKSGGMLKEMKQNFTRQLFYGFQNSAEAKVFDSISARINPLEISSKTPEELSIKLFGKNVFNDLETASEKVSQLEKNNESGQKDSILRIWKSRIENAEQKVQYLQKIEKLLRVYRSTGDAALMKDLEAKASTEFRQLVSNPQKLQQVIGKKTGLAGISGFLSLISQLKLGTQQLPFTGNSPVPGMANGVSAEININNTFLSFSTGRIIPSGIALPNTNKPDKQFNSSFWQLGFRKGKLADSHKGFRITGISGETQNIYLGQPTSLKPRSLVLANIFTRQRLFGQTWLSAEITKNISEERDDVFNLHNASIKLKMEGKVEGLGLVHQFYFNQTEKGYNDYLQHYLFSDGYDAGFSLKLKQKNKRSALSVRGAIRKYSMAGVSSQWSTQSLRGTYSLKVSQNKNLQLTFFHQDGHKQFAFNSAVQIIRQKNQGFVADVTLINKRIFGLYNTSFFSLGFQKDVLPFQQAGSTKNTSNSSTFTFVCNQNFLAGDNTYYLNLVYNKVDHQVDEFFFNSRLDLETGTAFKLNKNIAGSFSLVYGYFKNAYKNIGVKPALSGNFFRNISLEISGDIRKDIKIINPLFNQFFNLNCDIRYTIK